MCYISEGPPPPTHPLTPTQPAGFTPSPEGLWDPHTDSAGRPSVTKWAKSQFQPGLLDFHVGKKKRKIATHRVEEMKFTLRDRWIKYGCFTFGFML